MTTFDEFKVERAVGITEFANAEWCGFKGILKHRFSDFKVSEIDLDGDVVVLSENICDQSLSAKTEKEPAKVLTLEVLRDTLNPIITDDAFLQQLLTLNGASITTEVIPNKDDRTKVHQVIRSLFNGRLQSESSSDCIRIYSRGPQIGDKRKRDGRNMQPTDQHRYLGFSLRKENMDTLEVVQLLAKRLHMASKDFSYAGTKDRRGITVQRMVARNVTPAKLKGINKLFEDDRLAVSDIRVAEEPLKLGDLSGNRFELVIRNINGNDDESIIKGIEAFKMTGFLNYFGLQRFGTGGVPSHEIGKALLRGEYSAAVELILSPRENEPDERAAAARQHWKDTGDAQSAHDMFPHRYAAERQMLAHFSRDPTRSNDYLGAVLSINRELRLMYVHSVQSYIWNQMASERHAKVGRQLVVGDLVEEGILITEENVKNYSIEDLVLPMPGYTTVYPQSVDYEGALEKLKIDSLENAFKPKNKALWDLPGAYRKVYLMPKDLQYRLGRYSSPDEEISESTLSIDGEHRGLWISFSLPSSCYATMAIRELLHSSTDPNQHKALTKQHQ